MKELILSMLMSLSAETGIDIQPTVKVMDLPGSVAAQHAYGKKSGANFILVDPRVFRSMNAEEKRQTLLHEMAHAIVHEKHGHTERGVKMNKKHGSLFRKECRQLAIDAGVSVSACNKEL